MSTLLPSDADTLARRLTNGRVFIVADGQSVYLVLAETQEKIRLLPYQLTEDGIEHALADFERRPTPSQPR